MGLCVGITGPDLWDSNSGKEEIIVEDLIIDGICEI
jgi:hypothetical protein